MSYMEILKKTPCYSIKNENEWKEEYFTKCFESKYKQFKIGFYALIDDESNIIDVFGKAYYNYTTLGEIYNEYGDSNLEKYLNTWNLNFNVYKDTIILDEIFDEAECICEFLIDVSKIFKSNFLILSCDNKAVGYIENGECYRYEAIKKDFI